MNTMRNYSQDQCDDLDQIPRYVRSRNSQHYHTRAPPNQVKPKSSEKTSLDLVPKYEQPALPYYVVPVLYVPQKVLSNEEILPSNSLQSKNKSIFGSYVRQTKQQRLIMAEDYDIPFVTCTIDPQTAVDYQRDPYEIFADYNVRPNLINKSNLDDGDYNEEEEEEVTEEEEEEVEDVNYEGEPSLSGTSVREEEEAEAIVYEEDYDTRPVRYFTSPPTYKYYQNNQVYLCSRPNKSMQILDPIQNYQYKPNNYNNIPLPQANTVASKVPPLLLQGGSINYGGDVYRNQIFRNPNFEQPSHPAKSNDYAGTQKFHDSFYETEPFYYENHQVDNLAASQSNFNRKTNYMLMQKSGSNNTRRDLFPEVWSSPDQDCKLKPSTEKRLTCEDILRNYMQEKQISLESIRKTCKSIVSDVTVSSKKSTPSFNTPPCKESLSKQTDIIDDGALLESEAPAKLENQPSIKSSSDLKTIGPDKLDDVKTKLSSTESTYTRSVNSSTLSTSIASKERADSALANFVKTLSMTVIAAKASSECSTLKKMPSVKETRTNEICTIIPGSQSILDTKSTQTIDSLPVTTTSTVSTQTEQKLIVPDEKEVDLSKLLQNRESNKTLPDIDIFKPLAKPRDLSPSTFFQKYRKQSKPYAGVDHVKERKAKPEGSQQRLPGATSTSRPPSKASPVNHSKTKKAKKK